MSASDGESGPAADARAWARRLLAVGAIGLLLLLPLGWWKITFLEWGRLRMGVEGWTLVIICNEVAQSTSGPPQETEVSIPLVLEFSCHRDVEWFFTLGGGMRYATGWYVLLDIPTWAGILTAYPCIAAVREAVRRRRDRHGRCRSCGYDLTGNVSGRCPECGLAQERPALTK